MDDELDLNYLVFSGYQHFLLITWILFTPFKMFQPFPKQQSLDSSKLKEFVDDNFKFGENSRKFSKLVENTVGKREIACNEQLLLFSQCFQRLVLQTRKKKDLLGKGLNKMIIFMIMKCFREKKGHPL